MLEDFEGMLWMIKCRGLPSWQISFYVLDIYVRSDEVETECIREESSGS